jgi:hypothetical protein
MNTQEDDSLQGVASALISEIASAENHLQLANAALIAASISLRGDDAQKQIEAHCSASQHPSLQAEAISNIATIVSTMAEAMKSLANTTSFDQMVTLKGHHIEHMNAYLSVSRELNAALVSLVKLMQFDERQKIYPDEQSGFLISSGSATYGRMAFSQTPHQKS